MQITLKVENSKDLFLLIKLADRLGIRIISQDGITPPKKLKNNKWKYMGAVKLDGKLDNTNIRDFAHE